MPNYQYKGMNLVVEDLDSEHKGYFEAAAKHKLVMKKCKGCGLMRWPPGPGCPWCSSQQWEWQGVSGKGTIYSYEIVTQAINPAFSDWVPYAVVLVELDEQRGVPTADEALRMIVNIVDKDFRPEKEENVAVGKRVEVVFIDLGEGFSLPQFRLSAEAPKGPVWQYKPN